MYTRTQGLASVKEVIRSGKRETNRLRVATDRPLNSLSLFLSKGDSCSHMFAKRATVLLKDAIKMATYELTSI